MKQDSSEFIVVMARYEGQFQELVEGGLLTEEDAERYIAILWIFLGGGITKIMKFNRLAGVLVAKDHLAMCENLLEIQNSHGEYFRDPALVVDRSEAVNLMEAFVNEVYKDFDIN